MLHMEKHTFPVSVTGPLTIMCVPVGLMIKRRTVLGDVIANINVARSPIVMEFSLGYAAAKIM